MINYILFLVFLLLNTIEAILPLTRQTLFSTGFTQFENLYFNSSTRTFFSLGRDVAMHHSINQTDRRGYLWKNEETFPESKEIFQVAGMTIIILERALTPGHSTHFFHFLEHLLGIWNFQAEEKRQEVNLFILASHGIDPIKNWKGDNEIIVHLIKALFPNAEIVTWEDFLKAGENQIVFFEQVVTSDRSMENFKKEPFYTERMLGGYFQTLKKESLDHFASHIWNYCYASKIPSNKLKVTYVKRTGTRRLKMSCENELLQQIQQIPSIDLRIVDFASLTFQEQIQIIANTDVLLGVHGNGLSHALFLPEGGTLIELFPKNSLRVEYRIIAQSRNLNYFGWIDRIGWVDPLKAENIYGKVAVNELETNVNAIIELLKTIPVPN